MSDEGPLSYVINDMIELNLSYMPFIDHGGLFVPTQSHFPLGTKLIVELHIPGKNESITIEGKVVWLTPKNALHHVIPGVGIQFIGTNSANIRGQIEACLDKTMEVGGYTYGITEERKK